MKVLKQHHLSSDGHVDVTREYDVEIVDPDTGARLLDDADEPCVVVRVRAVTQDSWRQILRKHATTRLQPATRQLEEVIDYPEAERELLRHAIRDWRGFMAADDRPLPCLDAVKDELDPRVKAQIVRRLLGSEVREVLDASFRKPA